MSQDQEYEASIEGMTVEAELHLKEDAMDGAPVGITISDPSIPDNPLIYVNDSFVEITGYDREKILGTNCRFLQGEETDPEKVTAMADAVGEEEPVAVELVNYRKDGERFWNRVEIAPIRDESGEVTHFVGYQADVTDRKEAELALARERETLDHLLSRVTTLVPDITDTIVRAASRESLEAALTDRFAEVADFSGAWLGRYNPSTGRISPVAGDTRPPESLVVAGDSARAASIAGAIESGSVAVTETAATLFEGPGEQLGAAALIPLQYRETVYGLLAVAAPDPAVFDDRETAVLGALGQAAGAAINALESSTLESAASVIEARLEITDEEMDVVELAECVGAEVTLEARAPVETGQSPAADGPSLLLSISGVPGDAVTESVEAHDLGPVRVVADREEGAVIEWSPPDGPLARTLADDAVRLVSLSATPSGARLQFEAASEHMANTVVGRFREGCRGVELLAFHEVAAEPDTAANFRESVSDSLTERQFEALQKAYVSGFFAWPRDVEGEQLAAAMDIHPSTFHQHLRAAERKLIAAFFDR